MNKLCAILLFLTTTSMSWTQTYELKRIDERLTEIEKRLYQLEKITNENKLELIKVLFAELQYDRCVSHCDKGIPGCFTGCYLKLQESERGYAHLHHLDSPKSSNKKSRK